MNDKDMISKEAAKSAIRDALIGNPAYDTPRKRAIAAIAALPAAQYVWADLIVATLRALLDRAEAAEAEVARLRTAQPPAIWTPEQCVVFAAAYDGEDAAQRGEPAPWQPDEADEHWIADRFGCVQAGLAALRAINGEQTWRPVATRLVFNNADAKPKTCLIECNAASVPAVMAWYGAYHAGDRYTVAVNGRNVPMDHNGEPMAGVEGEK